MGRCVSQTSFMRIDSFGVKGPLEELGAQNKEESKEEESLEEYLAHLEGDFLIYLLQFLHSSQIVNSRGSVGYLPFS